MARPQRGRFSMEQRILVGHGAHSVASGRLAPLLESESADVHKIAKCSSVRQVLGVTPNDAVTFLPTFRSTTTQGPIGSLSKHDAHRDEVNAAPTANTSPEISPRIAA